MELKLKRKAFTNVYPAQNGSRRVLFDCDTDEKVLSVDEDDVVRWDCNGEKYTMINSSSVVIVEYVERGE